MAMDLADPNSADPGERFWAFSLILYGKPGNAAALLQLQDSHGADVNLILFLLWRADEGCVLTQADIVTAEQTIAPWRAEVIQPLRGIRRLLKDTPPDPVQAESAELVRTCVKAAELAAEEALIRTMGAILPKGQEAKGHGQGPLGQVMLEVYADHINTEFPGEVLQRLTVAEAAESAGSVD